MKLARLNLLGGIVIAAVGSLGATLAQAQTYHWTGNAGDNNWNTPGNWDVGTVPDNNSTGVYLDPQANGSIPTIPAGTTVDVGLNDTANSTFSLIFGPEFGQSLNIYGSLVNQWYLAPVAFATAPSVINMYGNSSYTGEGIGLGYNWFFNGAPYVTMNENDNSAVNINYFFWGGHLNLNGGTFSTATVDDGNSDQVSDLTRMMDISGGELIITSGDDTAQVDSWLSRGILEAYGGAGTIKIDTTSVPGETIVSGVQVPEPATIGVLALGGAAVLMTRRRRSVC